MIQKRQIKKLGKGRGVKRARKRVGKSNVIRKKSTKKTMSIIRRNNAAYNRAYDLGFDEAYNEGYNDGYKEGIEKGYQEEHDAVDVVDQASHQGA